MSPVRTIKLTPEQTESLLINEFGKKLLPIIKCNMTNLLKFGSGRTNSEEPTWFRDKWQVRR